HGNAEGLDIQAPEAILGSLADAQVEAAKAVRNAIPSIARAAEIIAGCLSSGGKLAYAAAGSSGLMALADALELPGTFGIQRDRIAILIAGGDEAFKTLAGGPEDDTEEASTAVANAGIGAGDCLIALSASGTTPYAVRAIEDARRRGAVTIGIANNRGSALLRQADTAILLETPPE
ncbi:MAG: N-acetylmuramic acid 6-phosphate etherase, partial [Mesorhizobium sp.]